eukprot:CAMPEP_0119321820 /NCGR_PEP_ID=MMETSP1333-20130426/56535_1 /TAXON_ID=418940 /ORGANISM="Scyphosphaera apsteinii, Strain RCC1455" /LENGTH=285 /DNA_ID=CAMNT_0007328891 /DNA_START=174 /DNA_END=1031 /DNA_ORIENTATION=-
MTATSTAVSSSSPSSLTAERYVATNRFRVKEGREAAFEKRWADRQSRLGMLDGFRFFCMLRRLDADADKPHEDDINYISCTVWEQQTDFEVWRKGDAFKEAHGGGTIGGIAGMLVATAMNTKGKPKIALWEGILPETVGDGTVSNEGRGIAWRQVEADGVSMLDGECFVAMNRFTVLPGQAEAFEQRFSKRESMLKKYSGFKGFLLLRRDGSDPDGFTYSTWSVWSDRASFEAWKNAEKKPVGGPPSAAPGAGPPSAGGPQQLFARPPVATFYEGILVLESAEGI